VPTHLFLCWVGQGILRSDIEGQQSFLVPLPVQPSSSHSPSTAARCFAALTANVITCHTHSRFKLPPVFVLASIVCGCVWVGVSVGGGLCL
jgi:hypothetical protein